MDQAGPTLVQHIFLLSLILLQEASTVAAIAAFFEMRSRRLTIHFLSTQRRFDT
jgi:hypothetical protein